MYKVNAYQNSLWSGSYTYKDFDELKRVCLDAFKKNLPELTYCQNINDLNQMMKKVGWEFKEIK